MAEVLAHLYFGQHFERVVTDDEGLCSVAGPVDGSVPEVNARIAIAGPCADLAFDIIEPPFPDDETVMRVVENWQFDAEGLMERRIASINEHPIAEADRKFRWPSGRRPDDHPGLSALGL